MTRAGERLIKAAEKERGRLKRVLKQMEAKMNTGGGTGC